jgi:hypothetical protein
MARLEVKTYFKAFYASFLERNILIHKLVSTTTEGAPAMTSEIVGLIGFRKEYFAFCHFVTHQQALYTEVTDFQHVMGAENSIRARSRL